MWVISLVLLASGLLEPSRAETLLGVAREGVSESDVRALLPGSGVERIAGSRGTYLLTGAVAERASASGLFASLEEDGPIQTSPASEAGGRATLSMDAQWALERIGAPEAWRRRAPSEKVVVAVLDSGVDLAHPDLAPILWTNAREIPRNGVDDDRNGYVDDVHGVDAHLGTGNPQDSVGHGTLCAGIIAATLGGRTRIMAVRAEDGTKRMSYSGVVRGGYYAAEMGARVINGSWGTFTPSPTVKAMIEEIGARGVILVNAVGNMGNDLDRQYPEYPASYRLPNVIAVTATDERDELVHYADRGERSVDLGAPGWRILTTRLGGGTAVEAGTSVAAPFVTAAVALLWAEEPLLPVEELKRRILDSTDPAPALAGKVRTGGRLNVARALEER